jgi:hypothetical protein
MHAGRFFFLQKHESTHLLPTGHLHKNTMQVINFVCDNNGTRIKWKILVAQGIPFCKLDIETDLVWLPFWKLDPSVPGFLVRLVQKSSLDEWKSEYEKYADNLKDSKYGETIPSIDEFCDPYCLCVSQALGSGFWNTPTMKKFAEKVRLSLVTHLPVQFDTPMVDSTESATFSESEFDKVNSWIRQKVQDHTDETPQYIKGIMTSEEVERKLEKLKKLSLDMKTKPRTYRQSFSSLYSQKSSPKSSPQSSPQNSPLSRLRRLSSRTRGSPQHSSYRSFTSDLLRRLSFSASSKTSTHLETEVESELREPSSDLLYLP